MSQSDGFRFLEWWTGLGRIGRVLIALGFLVVGVICLAVDPESWLWGFCIVFAATLLWLGLTLE